MSRTKLLAEVAADSYIQGYRDASNLLVAATKRLDKEELSNKLLTKFTELKKDKETNGSTNKEVTEGN